MRRTCVYVAGPFSAGSETKNVRRAVEVGDILLRRGYAPMVPHLNSLWDQMFPHEYEDWLALDMAWMRKADCVLRMPGTSPGADREVALALELGIPVYGSYDTLFACERETRP